MLKWILILPVVLLILIGSILFITGFLWQGTQVSAPESTNIINNIVE